MAAGKIKVSRQSVELPGCLLASLFHELANSDGDTEGFLVGNKKDHLLVSSLNDNSDTQVDEYQNVTHITSFIPCQTQKCFYDGSGTAECSIIDKILAGHCSKKAIVGWYRFRRNTSLQISMREKQVHRNLLKVFNEHNTTDFAFALFTHRSSDGHSTHSIDYAFYAAQNTNLNCYTSLPCDVMNLRSTSVCEYKHPNMMSPLGDNLHSVYETIVSKFKPNFFDVNGSLSQVAMVDAMLDSMLENFKSLGDSVTQSESQISQLIKEIEALEEKTGDEPSHNFIEMYDVNQSLDDSSTQEQCDNDEEDSAV
ncbi:BRCA1-A complex subunit Abraxas [Trichoplax sp. H2]|nr:BRCA1-A complex subunit Abraxas [Trichoplax sp. H2]|eukprot:RDD41977.1 BRCA1-A complex subunit Abraxas [Trichoplax sp. H2]